MKALVKGVICLGLVLLVSIGAAAQGSLLNVEADGVFYQEISMEKEQSYQVSFNLIADRPQSEVGVGIVFYQGNTVIEQFQSTHTLGEAGRSHRVSLDIVTPEEFSMAKLHIKVDKNSRYWWDAFSISRQERSIDAIRGFWEEKLANGEEVYTGLVVDLRGLDANRGMSPRVFTESGQLIYGGITASMDYIQSVGLVFYGHELNQELLNRIVADPSYPMAIPLTVKGVAMMEPGRVNAVISDEDGAKILRATETFDFLARFSVIFLVD